MVAPPLFPKIIADSNPQARRTASASALCSAIEILAGAPRSALRELPRLS